MLLFGRKHRAKAGILLLVLWGLSSLYLGGFHHHDADDCHEEDCPCAGALLVASELAPAPTALPAPPIPLLTLPDYQAPASHAEATRLKRLRGPPLFPPAC